MTAERWNFTATVVLVVTLLGTGVYLDVNGHGEWNWLFLGLASITPFFFGVASPNDRGGSAHEEEDSDD
jgi:hypothetical protein